MQAEPRPWHPGASLLRRVPRPTRQAFFPGVPPRAGCWKAGGEGTVIDPAALVELHADEIGARGSQQVRARLLLLEPERGFFRHSRPHAWAAEVSSTNIPTPNQPARIHPSPRASLTTLAPEPARTQLPRAGRSCPPSEILRNCEANSLQNGPEPTQSVKGFARIEAHCRHCLAQGKLRLLPTVNDN